MGQTSGMRIHEPTLWSPPTMDWVKINCDVAVKEEHNLIGLGIVVRYFQGAILATMRAPIEFCPSPLAQKLELL